MFRKMRRFKQEISQESCVEILKKEPRGVLAVHGEDGYPYAFPMDHIYIDGKLYFHCAKEGHKLDALERDNRVSYCVMDDGFKKDGEWALNINSVILFGTISKMDMSDTVRNREIIRKLGLKYYPTEESVDKEIENAFARVQMLELTIDHMSGKLVNES